MKKSGFYFLLVILFGCSPELPDSKVIIDELYNQKVEDFRIRKLRECREDALSDAEAHVDSIVYQLLNADLVDSLSFPEKLVRPTAPDHIIGSVKKF